jgi:cytochrome c biogenesis protein CcmG/thiol:disulfide interchange protein DsbE
VAASEHDGQVGRLSTILPGKQAPDGRARFSGAEGPQLVTVTIRYRRHFAAWAAPLASPAMSRPLASLLAAALLTAACSSASIPTDQVPPLPAITSGELSALLAASDQPVVVTIWASWCVPCRSEAPLFHQAQEENVGRIRFIGIDVRDSQDAARAFIAEFGLTGLEQYFDATGAVPADLGAVGVPHTFFYAPGGDLVFHQAGVIDERTLALQIDELRRRGG